MGQIQNAFLNAMGSLGQIAQLYRLSEPYIKRQEAKAEKKKLDEIRKNIKGDPIETEYKKVFEKYKESFKETPEMTKHFQEKYGGKDATTDWGEEKKNLTNNLKNLYKAIRDENDPDIQKGFALRVLLDKYHESPTSQSRNRNRNQAKGLEKTIDAAQEATDVRDNKRNMKNISGGMM